MSDPNMVNNLSSDAWSSEIDFIKLDEANAYERKGFHNRYHMAFERVVMPALMDPQGVGKEGVVLDAATGAGSGAAYLHEQLQAIQQPQVQVLGVDLSVQALGYAVEHYQVGRQPLSTLRYRHMDIVQAVQELPDGELRAVVCMETLEHVIPEVAQAFVQAVAEKLAPGGKAIFSSPRMRPRESTKRRDGHINEMYHQEFKHLLGTYFPITEFLSMDRYANVVPDTPDANLMLGIVSKWRTTEIF